MDDRIGILATFCGLPETDIPAPTSTNWGGYAAWVLPNGYGKHIALVVGKPDWIMMVTPGSESVTLSGLSPVGPALVREFLRVFKGVK